MSAAVEAGEAVTGFASGIRHGGESDGGRGRAGGPLMRRPSLPELQRDSLWRRVP